MSPTEEYWNNVAKQKEAYKELDQFVPGEAGFQYYPVPKEEHDKWRKDQDRKNMEAYEKREREKNNAVLEIREEEPRGNGHNTATNIEIPIEAILADTVEAKYPNIKKAATFNPDHCDLKKKSTRKRASNKKK